MERPFTAQAAHHAHERVVVSFDVARSEVLLAVNKTHLETLDSERKRLRSLRYGRPQGHYKQDVFKFIEQEVRLAEMTLTQRQKLHALDLEELARTEEAGTAHWETHQAEYYELAVFLASTLGGKEIIVGGEAVVTDRETMDRLDGRASNRNFPPSTYLQSSGCLDHSPHPFEP